LRGRLSRRAALQSYQRLVGVLQVAPVNRLGQPAAYRKRNTSLPTDAAHADSIGERRKPQPNGAPGYLRIDNGASGDQDGRKGLVSTSTLWTKVTQWGDRGRPHRKISEWWLLAGAVAMLRQFPFMSRGFHSGQRQRVHQLQRARLLGKLLHSKQTKSRAAPLRRQRPSRNPEWGHHPPSTIGFWLHRTRQYAEGGRSVFTRQHLEPYVELPPPPAPCPKSSPKPTGKTPPGLLALGHALGSYSRKGRRQLAESYPAAGGGRWAELAGFVRFSPIPKRRLGMQTRQAPITSLASASAAPDPQAAILVPESCGNAGPWTKPWEKPAIAHAMGAPRRFPTRCPPPLENASAFPHIPTASTIPLFSIQRRKAPTVPLPQFRLILPMRIC